MTEMLPTITVWGFDELAGGTGKDAPSPHLVECATRFFQGLEPDAGARWNSKDVAKLAGAWLRAHHPDTFSGSWLPQGVVLAAAQAGDFPLFASRGRLDGEIGINKASMEQRLRELHATQPDHAQRFAIMQATPAGRRNRLGF